MPFNWLVASSRRILFLILILTPAVLQGARSTPVRNFSAAAGAKAISAISSAPSALMQAAPSAPIAVPEFAVTTASGQRTYTTYSQVSPTVYTVDDATLSARVTALGSNQWALDITQVKQTITGVYFPWQSQRSPLDSNIADDVFYYPYIFGMVQKATNRNVDHTWWGLKYPGGTFSPLVVMADDRSAIIVAAANWPPKTVTPMYAAQRMILRYEETIPTGSTASYRAIIARVSGDASTGNAPWQLALDQYKNWLASNFTPTYPSWMWAGEGMLNIQLQNMTTFSVSYLDSLWQPVKSLYPWILMWGQMSAYSGGCCALSYPANARYAPDLTTWVRNTVTSAGYHVGFYSAPYYNDTTAYSLETSAGVSWLTGWMAANAAAGANS